MFKSKVYDFWTRCSMKNYLDLYSDRRVALYSGPLYNAICIMYRFANVFMHKVNEDIAPGYHSIVHRSVWTMLQFFVNFDVLRMESAELDQLVAASLSSVISSH